MSRRSHALRLFQPRHPPLSEQVVDLGRQVGEIAAAVRHRVSPRVEQAAHGAAEFAGSVANQLGPIAGSFARRAVSTGNAIRRDPVPLIVALGTLALLASLLQRRG